MLRNSNKNVFISSLYNYNMGKKEVLGVLFIVISILISLSNLTLVGAVIGTGISNSLGIIAVAFFAVGAILIAREARDPRARIDNIVKKYVMGKIDVVHTAAKLNRIIPIQNVKYRTGKQHTLVGERNAYPIDLRKGRRAEELAILEYLLAVKNNPQGIRQNKIEIARGLSTKHYMKAFKQTLDRFKKNHAPALETLLGIT